MFELLSGGDFENKRIINRNREGYRFCIKCKLEFLLSDANFHKEKSRPEGYSYTCKPCQKVIAKNKRARPNRKQILTEDQKIRRKINNKKWYSSVPISEARVKSYRFIDKKKNLHFNLTAEWYKENIECKPCCYCGTFEEIGCDRIDNKLGHTKLNVVPCCKLCNITRMNNFTHSEMLILGNTIREIRKVRKLFEVGKPII